MGSKYLSKASFFGFFKRFTTSDFPNRLAAGKKTSENDKNIQIVDNIRHQTGWKYYYNQLQTTMGKLVGGIESSSNGMERNIPTTGRSSFRQAKRHILQLVVDSKQRIRQLEKEFERLRNMLPYKEMVNFKLSSSQRQSSFSVSMMEEGKIGAYKDGVRITGDAHSLPPSNELLSQYDRDTTLAQEPRYKGRIASLKFPPTYTYRKSFMTCTSHTTVANRKDLPMVNAEPKVDSAVSLRTSQADVPRALMVQTKN